MAVHPDSTPLPVVTSTVQFAASNLRLTGAGSVCPGSNSVDTPLVGVSGAARQAVGGAAAHGEGLVSPPSNTGGNSDGVESNAINPVSSNSLLCQPRLDSVAVNPVMGTCYHDDNAAFRVEGLESVALSSVGTDYFRLTCDDSRSAERLALECVALASSFKQKGDRQRPWRYVGGYEDGWSCGPIAYAEGRNSVLVQASGVASDPLFRACKDKKLIGVKPTRFDAQATIALGADDPAYARRMAELADAYRQSGAREGYPFKVHVRDGFGDGDTLEIGTRGSEVYLRLYDKHREGFKKTHSKQVQPGQFAPGSWRFEAELKGSAATELYCRLWNVPGASEGHSEAVLSEVRGLFLDHGLDLPVGDTASRPIRELRYRSDIDRTRAWLRSAVRPSLAALIADGYLGELLSDLGLGELACVDLSALLLTRPVEVNKHGS